jgi:hypothetical protein
LKKLSYNNLGNDLGPTYLSYDVLVSYDDGTSKLLAALLYSDPLFDDEIYWGLSQEDGKTIESTCLNLKLWKFSSSSFDNPV